MSAASSVALDAGKWWRAARVLLSRFLLPVVGVSFAAPGAQLPALVALGAVIVWCVLEIMVEDEDSNRAAITSDVDGGTRLAVLGAHLLAIAAPVIELMVRGHTPRLAATVLGTLLIVTGGALRIVAVRTLGRFFTAHVQITGDQTVCRRGIYAWIRHPAYTGLALLDVGLCAACEAPVALVLSAVATVLAIRLRVAVEERALRSQLGAAYERYSAEVPRFLPTRWPS